MQKKEKKFSLLANKKSNQEVVLVLWPSAYYSNFFFKSVNKLSEIVYQILF